MHVEGFHKKNNHKNDQSVVSGHSVRLLGQVNLAFMSAKLNLSDWLCGKVGFVYSILSQVLSTQIPS